MMGKGLTILEKYLIAQAKTTAAHSFLTKTYQPFYFITQNDYGEVQLRLLCDKTKIDVLKAALLKGLIPADKKYPIVHDALTTDGKPVLFCCLLDVPRLVQFRTGIQLHGKLGRVIAFDFQREMLGRYLGNDVDFLFLSLEKLMEQYSRALPGV